MSARSERWLSAYHAARRCRLDIVRGTGQFSAFRFRVFRDAATAHDWHEGGHVAQFKTLGELRAFLDGWEQGSAATHLALAPVLNAVRS